MKRIFYLDFIRAVATFIVVLVHFNALFMPQFGANLSAKEILGGNLIGSFYLGAIGVSLFIIISGAALMYTWGGGKTSEDSAEGRERFPLAKFFKKRFLGIFPLFWICYLGGFLFILFTTKHIVHYSHLRDFIWSFLGMDGWVSGFGIPVTYVGVGEWFIGMVILLYFFFPPLLFVVKKCAPAALAGTFAIFLICIFALPSHATVLPFFHLFELTLGMCFIKYNVAARTDWKLAAGGALLFAICIFASQFRETELYLWPFVGIGLFCALTWLAKLLERFPAVVNVSKLLCKYSYPIFLTHHFVISNVANTFNLPGLTRIETYAMFALDWAIFATISFLAARLEKCILKLGKSEEGTTGSSGQAQG